MLWSGNGLENGVVCKFAHPEFFKNFCEYGDDHKLGCTKSCKCSIITLKYVVKPGI